MLERQNGKLAAIEVKTSDRVGVKDFKGIKVLQEMTKEGFVCGIVLYSGYEIVPFGEKLYAIPF